MKNTVAGKLKYWAQLFLLPIYWVSFLTPRFRKIWLFGSTFGRRFADNPRYLYLYISQNKKKLDLKPIWISHNKNIVELLNRNGYEAYYYKSIMGIFYCFISKVYIYDNYSKDINFWTSGGAVKVNLWHGIPLKKIQHDNIFDKVRNPKTRREKLQYFIRQLSDEKPSHFVLTTSDFLAPIFSSAFKTRHILVSDYPRIDYLINNNIKNILSDIEEGNKETIEKFLSNSNIVNTESDRKIIFYAPTFRESEKKFFEIVNINKLKSFLKENNMLLCIKLHPKSKIKKLFDAIAGNNILIIDADTDPYIVLKITDILITDYSSIYFDFLLTNKPIIFFNYDLKEYLKGSRKMYFKYEDFTPGEKVQTMEQLMEALVYACNMREKYIKKYQVQRKSVIENVFNKKTKFTSKDLIQNIDRILNMNKI